MRGAGVCGWAFEKSLFSCPRPPVAPSHLPHKHNNTHALPLAFSLSRVGGGERYLRPIEMKAITSGVRALNKCHEEMMEKKLQNCETTLTCKRARTTAVPLPGEEKQEFWCRYVEKS